MEFRVLGTLDVVREGEPLELGGPKQRAVLAILLIHANRVVVTDQLLEALWGESGDALRNRLWVYVSNLRSVLEPARQRPGSGDVLLTRSSGYVLRIDEDDLDSARFERLVAEGRSSLDVDPEHASRVLQDALGLWRGRAYENFVYEDFAQDEIRRLTELRLGAVEDRVDADLRTGKAREVVTELEALCGQHPLRERLRALHMLALYRSGRQVEALRAYQRTRSHLTDELGLDPSPELAALEERILAQDPSLDIPRPVSRPAQAGGVRGYELRNELGTGPSGTVHRAYHSALGREVALKIILGPVADTSEFVARFEDEARRIAQLEHPHIVPLYDWWREPGAAYLAMPLLGGGDLARFLADEPGYAAGLAVIEQVGGALSHAHRQGEVHGNVKPANVLVDAEGNAYLADFGLAGTPEDGHLAPEQQQDGPPRVASDIYALGVLARQVLVTTAGSELPPLVAAVLDRATARQPSERFQQINDLLRALRQAMGLDVVAMPGPLPPPPAPVRNPYKGLRAFQQADAEDFFGRGAVVDRLVEAVATYALVAVVGPSGSGKSSVLKAGLLPRLQQGALPVLVTEMFPGSYPFEELETALRRVATQSPDGMLEDLTSGPRGLVRVIKQVLPDDGSELVLVIDQFEELFSMVDSEETRVLFLDSLAEAVSDPRSRLRVVLTLRADFFDRPLEYQGFGELVRTGLVPVTVPSEDELARAVSGPARRVGLDLEPGLVAAVVGDVVGQPGGLPLLQYALTELVEHRDSDVLTVEAYRRGGGVAEALGTRAEELYATLGADGREATRQAFLRLVTVEPGSEGTRRRVRRMELAELDVDQGQLDTALHRLGAHRLLSFDRDPVTRGPTVEVAHEALLREWDRLAGWIDDRRDELILSRRIRAAAQEWAESREDPSCLLRGARLEQAETWRERTDLAPTREEVRYLDTSREQRRVEAAASRRRRRWTLAVLSAGLVMVGVAAAVAVVQRGVAQAEARQEEVRRLAASSALALEEDPERAILLALEAAEVSRREGEPVQPEAIAALHEAVQSSRLEVRSDQYLAAGFDPDGAPVLEELLHTGAYPDDWPGATVSPDGRFVAERVLDDDNETGEIVVWEVATRREVVRLEPRTTTGAGMYVTHRLQWHPNGPLLAAEVSDRATTVGELRLWETGSWEQIASIPIAFEAPEFAPDSIASVGAFPDADTVAVLDPDGQVVLFDFATFDEIDHIGSPIADTARAVIDPERGRLLTGSSDSPRRVEQWDLDTGRLQWSTEVADASGIAVSTATGLVVSFGLTGEVRLHDPETGSVVDTLHGHRNPVSDVTFSPDGTHLVSRSATETLVWDVSAAGPRALGTIRIDAGPRANPMALSPEDAEVAVLYEGGLSRYRMSDGTTLGGTEGMTGIFFPAPVSPDWQLMGFIDDGSGVVQDLSTGDTVLELPSCTYPMAFSSDGGMVVANGIDLCSESDAPPGADLRSRVLAVPTGEEVLDLGERLIFAAGGAAFNPAGVFDADQYLAVIFSPEEVLEVHDMAGGNLVASLQFSHLPINVSFDPTGRYVAVGVSDGSVQILDLAAVVDGIPAEEALVFNQTVDAGSVGVELGADGLMATHTAGSLRLWNFHSGEHLLDIPVVIADDRPFPIFTHDGDALLYRDIGTLGQDVLRRLSLDPDELLALARDRVTRDLTPDECERHHLDC